MIDKDKTLVYSAEQRLSRILDEAEDFPTYVAFNSTVLVPRGGQRIFGTIETIQKYCDHVVDTSDIRHHVTVRSRRGSDTRAHYEPWSRTIAVPDNSNWGMSELTVLHELAHHFAWNSGADHDAKFRQTYINLIREYMDPVTALILASIYEDTGLTAFVTEAL